MLPHSAGVVGMVGRAALPMGVRAAAGTATRAVVTSAARSSGAVSTRTSAAAGSSRVLSTVRFEASAARAMHNGSDTDPAAAPAPQPADKTAQCQPAGRWFAGLSILVTVFGTASRNEAEKQLPSFMAQATPEQKAKFAETHELPVPWGHEVLTQGISTAFTAAMAMATALALLTAVLVIRVRRSDLDALSGKASAGGPGVQRPTSVRAPVRRTARRQKRADAGADRPRGCGLHLPGSPGTAQRSGSVRVVGGFNSGRRHQYGSYVSSS